MFFRPHKRVVLKCTGPSKTRQEFADECDINRIMAKYQKTGVMPMAARPPIYVDNWDAPDFMGAMNILLEANEAFMRLPATVRREFDNDPSKFVAYCEDKENLPKLREWGLAAPEKLPDAPMRVEVVNPAPPAGGAE